MGQGQGLGFERERKERPRSPERDRPARRRGPREDRARPRTPPRRRPASRSRSADNCTCFAAARSASLCLSSPAMECIGPDQLASDLRSECKTICLGSDCHTPGLLQIPVTRL